MIARKACLFALATTLAACMSPGPFPSLAPREGERLAIEEPVRAPPQIAPDSGLRMRVLELRQQAALGERAFDAAYGPAEAAMRRAGAPGSDSWTEAEQAMSRLEAARGETTTALAQLDLLAAGRADMATNDDDYEAILGMQAVVQDVADAQQRRIDRLRSLSDR